MQLSESQFWTDLSHLFGTQERLGWPHCKKNPSRSKRKCQTSSSITGHKQPHRDTNWVLSSSNLNKDKTHREWHSSQSQLHHVITAYYNCNKTYAWTFLVFFSTTPTCNISSKVDYLQRPSQLQLQYMTYPWMNILNEFLCISMDYKQEENIFSYFKHILSPLLNCFSLFSS